MTQGRPDPARQALGRPLTEAEQHLAEALVGIFAGGMHDFSAVVAELNVRDVPLPSGTTGPWTIDLLTTELARINLSLDAAYAGGGFVVLP